MGLINDQSINQSINLKYLSIMSCVVYYKYLTNDTTFGSQQNNKSLPIN